jgi:hypothetical protein
VPSVSDFSDAAAEILRGLGAEPVVIGALAAMLYRTSDRATSDADFLIRDVTGIPEAFASHGLQVSVVGEPGEAPLMYLVRGGDVRIDLVVSGTEYQDLAMARAVDGHLAIEDVLVHKLIAWRPRDRDDVRSILEAGHPFDQAYVADWAEAWQVAERWAEAQRWHAP